MTKWLANKYAKENTTCNMISPAGVSNKQNTDEEEIFNLIPLGKMAEPKDIFGAINPNK